MSQLARIGLYPLSVLNTVAGVALMAIATVTSDVPLWVSAPAVAVAAQGAYTLVWLLERAPVPPRFANLLFAGGEALALIGASIGIIAAVIAQSASSDPEYGPPTMMMLVAIHALVGLLAAPRSPADHSSALL